MSLPGRILRPQLSARVKLNMRRKTVGRSSGKVGTHRRDHCDSISHARPANGRLPAVSRRAFQESAVLLHCSSTGVRFDPSSRSVTGQNQRWELECSTASSKNEKPCVLWTGGLVTFVSSDRMVVG